MSTRSSTSRVSAPCVPVLARWSPLLPLPAILLGVLVMRAHGVSPAVWGQNAAVGFLGVLASAVPLRARLPERVRELPLGALCALGVLLATFVSGGIEGVHRWVALGPVRLHGAAIVLPMALVSLDRLLAAGRVRGAAALAGALLGLLVLQPDAAQATAFSAAALVSLQRARASSVQRWLAGAVLVAGTGAAWLRPDPLGAVPHVEGIVGLAASLGPASWAAALVALWLVPLPFFIAWRLRAGAGDSHAALMLGVYVVGTLVAPLLGDFPVPLMGYGVSPLLGYFGALAWVRGAPRE